MDTVAELRQAVVDQLRRMRLEEKRLRAMALAYAAGELDVADLALVSLRYAATVDVYRQLEAALLRQGERIPKAVRDGAGSLLDWQTEEDAEITQPCMRGATIQ